MVNKCGVCGKATSTRCSRCRKKSYCSRECQRVDWTEHKKVCDTLPAAGVLTHTDPENPLVAWDSDARRGRFVVARRPIPKGTLIFTEEPLAATATTFRAGDRFKDFLPEGSYCGDAEDPATVGGPKGENGRLTEVMRRRGWDERAVAAGFHLHEGDGKSTIYDRAIAANNFQMHCQFTGFMYGVAMVRKASAINHSCDGGNAKYYFGARGVVYVAASADIDTGDEVTFPYFQPAACRVLCTHERNVRLRPILGRDCICERCVAGPCETPCRIRCYSAEENALVEHLARVIPGITEELHNAGPPAVTLRAMLAAWDTKELEPLKTNALHLSSFAARFVGCVCLLGERFDTLDRAKLARVAKDIYGYAICLNEPLANEEVSPFLFRAISAIVSEGDGNDVLMASIAWIVHRIKMAPWMRPRFAEFASCVGLISARLDVAFKGVADLDSELNLLDRVHDE